MIFDYSYDSTGKIQMVVYRENATATPECYYYALNSRDNVIGIYESDGDLYAEYTYDAWGNITSITNSSVDSIANYENIATRQPFRYRGYYYDTETELYYVHTRYYDPLTHRFVNADDIGLITASTNTLTDKNLYTYCDNNPVVRTDDGGEFWETAFDVVSLGASIVEVAINPTDPWAWAGVVGDALDLIPFVTGVGEATRGVRTLVKAVDKADDVIDVAKSTRKAVKPSVGVYEITYKSGMNYVGKGNFNRAITSAKRYTNLKCDTVTSIKWKASKNSRSAFIEEFALQTKRGVNNKYTYNKIWSPGKRYYISSGGKLRRR